jgi:RHS repeat-associated protein
LIRATGPMAKTNPFRFSTKYQDEETGLVYYGYRYYDSSAGRWLNRDPLGEIGFHLVASSPVSIQSSRIQNTVVYQFVGNDPVDTFDRFGLLGIPTCGYGCVPPPDPRPPAIDCSGYSRTFGASPCRTCENGKFASKKDTYPERAKTICEGFQKRYTTTPFQTEAACVASCLIAEESACQQYGWCDARNCCRLQAHVRCYAKCGFVPVMGMPKGGPALGWQELIPACARLGMSKADMLLTGLF